MRLSNTPEGLSQLRRPEQLTFAEMIVITECTKALLTDTELPEVIFSGLKALEHALQKMEEHGNTLDSEYDAFTLDGMTVKLRMTKEKIWVYKRQLGEAKPNASKEETHQIKKASTALIQVSDSIRDLECRIVAQYKMRGIKKVIIF